MALTAQQVYNQSLGVQRGRVNQMYGRNLEILAREMRDARERTEANLEGRGVLRSGEANTARSRLSESEAAQRKYLSEDRGYQLSQIDLDEQARRAALASSGGGGAKAMPATGGRTPEQILRESGFTAPRPVGQRLTLLPKRPAGTVATKRYGL